jgi:integrase/recombinase XerD
MSPRQRLADLLEPWLEAEGSRSTNTARAYRRAVEDFLALVGEEAVDPESVRHYMAGLKSSHLADSSRAARISAVRSFLRFAQGRDVIAESPVDLLKRPTVEVTSGDHWLDENLLGRFLRAAAKLGNRHYAACLLMVATGARVGEAAAAEWKDLYRDVAGRVGWHISGKGNRRRDVKIPDQLFAVLVGLHGGTADLDDRDPAPLIPDSRGTHCAPNTLWRLVNAAAKAADLGKSVSPHWLRHTHATLAALGGASAFVIQASMGHARLETSARYVHFARALADTSADYLPAAILTPKRGRGRPRKQR